MIGVYNHLLRKVFRFHYHSQKVIGSLGDDLFDDLSRWDIDISIFPKPSLILKTIQKSTQQQKNGWHGMDVFNFMTSDSDGFLNRHQGFNVTHPKSNSSSLKHGGWKTIRLSYWVSVSLQGKTRC